jgi:putative glutamine amidotransferase
MTPLIGITTYNDVAQWRDWSAPAAVLPRTYVDAIRRGGGRPALLPPGGTPAEAALTVADLDGLVVAGGDDVDPARYGAAMHPATGAPNAERDAWELAMIDCALAAGLPLLAICRGMQLLNVIRGGTLHQHLPQVVGHEEHSGVADDFGRHAVRIGTAGAISRILTPDEAREPAAGADTGNGHQPGGPGTTFGWPAADGHWIEVATHHHQAVDRLGNGLTGTAWTADGTVEAVEFAPAAGTPAPRGFAIGVQWHPEETGDARLFSALADAASKSSGLPGQRRRAVHHGVVVPCGRRHLGRLRHPGAGALPSRGGSRCGPRSVTNHEPQLAPAPHGRAARGTGGPVSRS